MHTRALAGAAVVPLLALATVGCNDDPAPAGARKQLGDAEPTGLVVVPTEFPKEFFLEVASTDDGPGTRGQVGKGKRFVADFVQYSGGVVQLCAAKPADFPAVCPVDTETAEMSQGTTDGVQWHLRFYGGDQTPAWRPTMTRQWQQLAWVDDNEKRPKPTHS